MRVFLLFVFLFPTTISIGQGFKHKKKIDKYIFKDKNKTKIIVDEYLELLDKNYKIRIGDQWGMIDQHGGVLIKPEFQAVFKFDFDRAIVNLDNKFGVVDKSSEFLIPPVYDRIDYSNEDETLVQIDNKWLLLTVNDTIEIENPKPFLNPDILPVLEGCEQQNEECTDILMTNIFYKNVIYPAQARNKRIQGTLYSELTIDETGSLEAVKLLNSLGGGIDEEVKNLINVHFTKWQPAMQGDELVKSRVIFPTRFLIR